MRGTKKALRQGIYQALQNVISVDVFDGVAREYDTACVVIGNISESQDNTFSTFRTDCIVDLDIRHKQEYGYSRDIVDDIEDEILQVLIPSVDHAGFTVSGFNVYNVVRQSGGYIDEPGTEFNIVRNILRIGLTLS